MGRAVAIESKANVIAALRPVRSITGRPGASQRPRIEPNIDMMRRARSIVFIAFAGCTGGDGNPSVHVPQLVYPDPLTVTEGDSTTFTLGVCDGANVAAGSFYFYDSASTAPVNELSASPDNFRLSARSSRAIAIVAADDSNAMNEQATLTMYVDGAIAGESPQASVIVIDKDAQNLIASSWSVTVPPSSSASFDVRLAQAPTAPVTVMLQSSDAGAVDITPGMVRFGAADYDVPRTITVSRYASSAEARISLLPTGGIPAEEVAVVAPFVCN